MKTSTTEKYTLLTALQNFGEFRNNVNNFLTKIKDQNIILDLSQTNPSEKEINSLKEYAGTQIENNKSFIIILKSFDADAFSEELNVVPTLTEAEDIIDMDEMTRDLGF